MRHRRKHPLITLLALAAIVGALLAAASPPAQAQTQYPGENDPITPQPSGLTQFPDDEVAVVTDAINDPGYGVYGLYPDQNYLITDTVGSDPLSVTPSGQLDPQVGYQRQFDVAKGRIVDPTRDVAVTLMKAGFDSGTSTMSWALQQISFGANSPPTVPTIKFTSPTFYENGLPSVGENSPGALAVGDLDRATDSKGQAHDEIVLAYENFNASRGGLGSDILLSVERWDPVTQTLGPSTYIPALPNSTAYAYVCGMSWLGKGNVGCPLEHPGVIDVAVANLEGDLYPEIALLAHTVPYTVPSGGVPTISLQVMVFSYCPPGLAAGDPRVAAGICAANAAASLQLRASTVVSSGKNGQYNDGTGSFHNPAELAAGDFDGDGVEDLAVTHLTNQHRYDPGGFDDYAYVGDVTLSILSWDATASGTNRLPLVWFSNAKTTPLTKPIATVDAFYDRIAPGIYAPPPHYHDLRIAAGLFKFSPVMGYTLGRRQIALAYVPANKQIQLELWDITSPNTPMPNPPKTWTAVPYEKPDPLSICGDSYVPIGLQAGNWAGVESNPANPLHGLGLSYELSDLITTELYRVDQNVDPKTANGPLQLAGFDFVPKYGTPAGQCGTGATHTELLSFDIDGNSLELGPPSHMVVTIPQSFDYILEEPPQHIDYFPDGGLINVSREKDFYVSYGETASTSFGTKTNKSTSWSVGTSITGNETFGIDANAGIFSANANVSVTDQFGYNYSSNQQSYVGSSDVYTSTLTTQTAGGDSLQLRTKVVDIWRYPIYGINPSDIVQPVPPPNPPRPYNYYELYLPRANDTPAIFVDDLLAQQYGYQPAHENGNVLSYPAVTAGTTYSPPDQGPWIAPSNLPGTVQCENNTRWCYNLPVTAAGQQFTYGRTNNSLTLQIDQAWSKSTSREWTSKFSDTLGVEASVKVSDLGVTASACLNVQLNGSGSWGKSSTSTNSSDTTQTLSVSVPGTQDSTKEYVFSPLMYLTNSGVIKVGHGSAVTPGPDTFWSEQYSGPDWALSLPRKFNVPDPKNQSWEINKDWRDGQQIRGFWVRSQTLNPISNSYDVVDGVKQGQSVFVDVRMYNYSAAQASGAVPVQLSYEPVDPANKYKATGPRKVLTTVQATAIPYHGQTDNNGKIQDNYTTVRFAIDGATTQAWLPAGATSQTYRIWMVINPDDPANKAGQTHGWRQPNVILTPTKVLNPGSVVSLNLVDPANPNQPEVVSYTSQGTNDDIAAGLAAALKDSKAVKALGASVSVQDTTTSTPSIVVFAAGAQPPAGNEYRAGMTAHNRTFYFVPTSVDNRGNPTVTATNLEYGQNNEGFGLLTVMAPTTPGPMLGGDDPCASKSGYSAERGPDIRMNRGSLTAMPLNGRMDGSKAVVRAGDRVPIRVSAFADIDWAGFERVNVFQGDPEDNAKVVGTALIRGITKAGGGHDWFTWQAPMEPGTYELVAQLHESWNDARPGNDQVSIEVVVEPAVQRPYRFFLSTISRAE